MRNPFRRRSETGIKDYSGMFRSVRTRHRKRLRHPWQWALIAAAVFVVVIAGGGAWLYFDLLDDVQTGPDLPGPRTEDGLEQPFNALLVGSDSRRGLSKAEQERLGANPVESQRADTLILAHIDPEAGRVTMLQFPRDLYVPILNEGPDRINSALEKGHEHLVRAVEDLTGLEVNRYAQVNIAGFRDLVEAIGGVEVCITEPIPFDSNTGFEITRDEVGLVQLDGDDALAFVRSRKTLPGGDFDRIRNQQKFIAAAMNKIMSVGTILRPDRLLGLKSAAGDNLVLDKGTDLFEMRDLANRLRSPDPEHYEAYTVPNKGPGFVGEASVVKPDHRAMRILFDAIAANESPAAADGVPDIAPSTVRVGVYNTSGEDGAASRATRQLRDATSIGGRPVRIVDVGNARRSDLKRTVILHRANATTQARLVAAVIPGAVLRQGRTARGIDVAVLVGRRFRTARLVQLLPIPLPAPAALPPECRGG